MEEQQREKEIAQGSSMVKQEHKKTIIKNALGNNISLIVPLHASTNSLIPSEVDQGEYFEESASDSEESFWEYQEMNLQAGGQDEGSSLQSSLSEQSKGKFNKGNKNSASKIASMKKANQFDNEELGCKQEFVTNKANERVVQDDIFFLNNIQEVKPFPQGEDEASMFEWWDQIDTVYFPPSTTIMVDEMFNKTIQQLKIKQNITNYSGSNNINSNSCYYINLVKDYYGFDPIPFKLNNYLSVFHQLVEEKNGIQGYLTIYKYKGGRTNTFQNQLELTSSVQIVNSTDINAIDDILLKSQQQESKDNMSNSQFSQSLKRKNKQIDSSQSYLSQEFEPKLQKRLVIQSEDIPGINQNGRLKLKKVIALDKNGMHSAFFQTQFLNRKQQTSQGVLNTSEKGEISDNIEVLNSQLKKIGMSKQLQDLKTKVKKIQKEEGNYLLTRELSVKINDNLKWMLLHKNFIMGFGDRMHYDTQEYFKGQGEEKSGINLQREEVLRERQLYNEGKLKLCYESSIINKPLQGDQKVNSHQIGKSDTVPRKGANMNEQNIPQSERKNSFSSKSSRNKIQPHDGQQHPNISKLQKLPESPSINIKEENSEQSKEDLKQKYIEFITSTHQLDHNNGAEGDEDSENKSKLLETDCGVCFHHVNNDNNPVVYCSQCNSSFHKICYGIDFIPEEKFLCSRCEVKNTLSQQTKRKFQDLQSPIFQCKLCTEPYLPVITMDSSTHYFYHPTCLFVYNYAIYDCGKLLFRKGVSHESIISDIAKESNISCESCLSKRGRKIQCQGTVKIKAQNIQGDSTKIDLEECDSRCNVYVHPLCGFLNGMEVWVDNDKDDAEKERQIEQSQFTKIDHLKLDCKFKCSKHADKVNRDDEAQMFFRRYQLNYKDICNQANTLEEFKKVCKDERENENANWQKIVEMEQQYFQSYSYLTKVKINGQEVIQSMQQQKLAEDSMPFLKVNSSIDLVENEDDDDNNNSNNNNYSLDNNNKSQKIAIILKFNQNISSPILENKESNSSNTSQEISNYSNIEDKLSSNLASKAVNDLRNSNNTGYLQKNKEKTKDNDPQKLSLFAREAQQGKCQLGKEEKYHVEQNLAAYDDEEEEDMEEEEEEEEEDDDQEEYEYYCDDEDFEKVDMKSKKGYGKMINKSSLRRLVPNSQLKKKALKPNKDSNYIPNQGQNFSRAEGQFVRANLNQKRKISDDLDQEESEDSNRQRGNAQFSKYLPPTCGKSGRRINVGGRPSFSMKESARGKKLYGQSEEKESDSSMETNIQKNKKKLQQESRPKGGETKLQQQGELEQNRKYNLRQQQHKNYKNEMFQIESSASSHYYKGSSKYQQSFLNQVGSSQEDEDDEAQGQSLNANLNYQFKTNLESVSHQKQQQQQSNKVINEQQQRRNMMNFSQYYQQQQEQQLQQQQEQEILDFDHFKMHKKILNPKGFQSPSNTDQGTEQ